MFLVALCATGFAPRVGLAPSVAAPRRAVVSLGPPPGTPGGPPTGGPPPGTPGGPPTGGPPPGTPGGPPGGPPGTGGPPGAGGGGPPPRTAAQQAVDGLFEAAFPLLYAFEPDGMLDSEKNLRVLWVRALLAAAGKLDDDVAAELLPSASRWLVSAPLARSIWAPVMPKLDWVRQRTSFIDDAVDGFVSSLPAGAPAQVVLLGSGYDTRALRYRDAAGGALSFFEVDLPNVITVKRSMAQKYLGGAAGGDAFARTVYGEQALGVDLNKAAGSVFEQLGARGLSASVRTLVVCEAVLFYLSPPAKRALLAEAAACVGGAAGSSLVLTDNLAPYVRSPARDDAAAFLSQVGLKLTLHDSLWGGAIQFVRAEAA